jgi:hypothetical protein
MQLRDITTLIYELDPYMSPFIDNEKIKNLVTDIKTLPGDNLRVTSKNNLAFTRFRRQFLLNNCGKELVQQHYSPDW